MAGILGFVRRDHEAILAAIGFATFSLEITFLLGEAKNRVVEFVVR
jgi:hypothetical protein